MHNRKFVFSQLLDFLNKDVFLRISNKYNGNRYVKFFTCRNQLAVLMFGQLAKNSWYFRNALVRANYVNYSKNVTATPLFLERFFDNLLFGAKHELHNRDMHISKCQNDMDNSPKCQIGPLDVTLEEKALLEFVKANPKATQEQIAKHIGKSLRTVKRITSSLYEKGYLKRENGKRNGVWITIE